MLIWPNLSMTKLTKKVPSGKTVQVPSGILTVQTYLIDIGAFGLFYYFPWWVSFVTASFGYIVSYTEGCF